jgi:hypothetical protein
MQITGEVQIDVQSVIERLEEIYNLMPKVDIPTDGKTWKSGSYKGDSYEAKAIRDLIEDLEDVDSAEQMIKASLVF